MSGLLPVVLGNPPEPSEDELRQQEEKARFSADQMGAKLTHQFEQWKEARRAKEDEWIEDLRAYNGIDSEESYNLSDVYVHLTRTKVQVAFARLSDLMFQSDKHWGIKPTPKPRLSKQQRTGIAYMLAQATGMMPSAEDVEKVATQEAAAKAEAMEKAMHDQLVEADYESLMKVAILEACIIGSGAIKGVTVGVRSDESWAQGSGMWDVKSEEVPIPVLSSVSAFDLYPDPMATTVDECEGIFERHVLPRHKLNEMAEKSQFDMEALGDVLRGSPNGNHRELQHETDRRVISGITVVDENLVPRFELLEYWGYLSGADLKDCGCEVQNEDTLYLANIWVCGGRTLKAKLSRQKPSGQLPYRIFPYEQVPHQFWGVGVARQMRDSQIVMNKGVRTLLDNLALSSGPQTEVNMALLAPGEDPTDMKPWKVWLRDGGDPAYPAVRFFQPQPMQNAVAEVIDMFRRFADEETNMPSYTHGQTSQGLNKTASGMSMLMGAANVAIKSIVRNIDTYLVQPLIESLYHWNMQWNEDESIKGDMEIYAQGSTALIAKEVQSERMLQFAQMTANPIDLNFVDRLKILRSVAESMDIQPDKVLIDEEQLQLQQQQQAFAAGGAGGFAPGQTPGMANTGGVPFPVQGPMQG
ncbi:MAG: hypothetical protein HQL47_06135 [Gammaproteobacteria bacterium]|nr:hypothetical protein [Gammaproteobacteria bacterium]